MDKSFKSLLIDLGISSEGSIKEFHPRVRDTEKVSVLKCSKSGAYFLSDNEYGSEETYKNVSNFEYWQRDWSNHNSSNSSEPPIFEDDRRRIEQFQPYLKNKVWLDFGCGSGGALRLGKESFKEVCGLEIQSGPRGYLNQLGIRCYESLDEVEKESIEVMTLFHVYEHLQNPIKILEEISEKLVSGGRLILEVPQANDILLSLFDLGSFKDFTFWSEHLILHTRSTLTQFVNQCTSLKIESIQGFQRYPLSNHLYWLANSLPGGHEKWSFLNNDLLEKAYSSTLQSLDKTDTLIAYIRKD